MATPKATLPKSTTQAQNAPRSMKDAFRLGYTYELDIFQEGLFVTGQFLPDSENTVVWEGELGWELDSNHASSQGLPQRINTRVRMRIEFLEIRPEK